MKQPQTLLLAFIATTLLFACKGIDLKEEQAYAAKISGALNGVAVEVGAVSGVSTDKGSYSQLEVEIKDFPVIEAVRDHQLTYASSVPAILYFKDSALRKKNYQEILVKVNEGKDASAETVFTMKDIEQADGCVAAFNGFAQALRTMNKDSLQFYADPELWKEISTDSLIVMLKQMEDENGPAGDVIFSGFRKDETGKCFVFPMGLQRKKLNHRIFLAIDPVTKKVINFRV